MGGGETEWRTASTPPSCARCRKAGKQHPILAHVYRALQAKGYDPITQLVGFVLTGDPTYITSYDGARSMICRLERDDILEELVRFYIANRLNG